VVRERFAPPAVSNADADDRAKAKTLTWSSYGNGARHIRRGCKEHGPL